MPFKPGNSGRPKGSPNKRTLIVQELAEKCGMDPLEILLRFANGDWKGLGYENEVYFAEKAEGDGAVIKMGYVITPEMRIQAAKEASRYLHAPKKEEIVPEPEAIDVSPENEEEIARETLEYIESKYPQMIAEKAKVYKKEQ